jgi:hypothetical protein
VPVATPARPAIFAVEAERSVSAISCTAAPRIAMRLSGLLARSSQVTQPIAADFRPPPPSTLLTNGLCRRDKRRAGAAPPHISSPIGTTPAVPAAYPRSQEPRIMGVFHGFHRAC